MSLFKRGRHFTPFLGLDSRQHSTDGKQENLEELEVRERDIWRRLIIGAMAVARWRSVLERAHRRAVIVPLPARRSSRHTLRPDAAITCTIFTLNA